MHVLQVVAAGYDPISHRDHLAGALEAILTARNDALRAPTPAIDLFHHEIRRELLFRTLSNDEPTANE